jgi:hypothetical protein
MNDSQYVNLLYMNMIINSLQISSRALNNTIIAVAITLIEKKGVSAKAIKIDKDLFHTDTIFNVGAIGIFAILAVLYTIWW